MTDYRSLEESSGPAPLTLSAAHNQNEYVINEVLFQYIDNIAPIFRVTASQIQESLKDSLLKSLMGSADSKE